MTDIGKGPSGPESGGFQGIFNRLLSFDELIGGQLLRILYYVGLVGIVIWALAVLVGSLAMAQYSPGAALLGLIGAFFILVLGTLFWRFTCELWMVIFKIHDRLGEIRDRLPPR